MKTIAVLFFLLTIQTIFAHQRHHHERSDDLNRICKATRIVPKKDENKNDLLGGLLGNIGGALGKGGPLKSLLDGPLGNVVQELSKVLQRAGKLVAKLLRKLTELLGEVVEVNEENQAEANGLLKYVVRIAHELAKDPDSITEESIREAIEEDQDLLDMAARLGLDDNNLEKIVSQAICFIV